MPADYNPRKISDEALLGLKNSINDFGSVQPIIANTKTGNVIGGHQRLQAMLALGVETDTVAWGEFSEDEEKALNITLNNHQIAGEFDNEKLSILLDELRETMPEAFELYRLSELGVDLGILNEIVGGGTAGSDPDDIPDISEDVTPLSKTGDLYVLGRHILVCGDCTDESVVSKVMGQQEADLLWTDPPYGVSYSDKNAFLAKVGKQNHIQTPIKGDHLNLEDLATLWNRAFTQMFRVLKKGASFYITGPQGPNFQLKLFAALDAVGLLPRHTIIWVKNVHVLGRSDYHYKHEPMFYGWKEGAGHKFYGDATKNSVWEIAKPRLSDLHPTMKPIELIEEALRNNGKEGDIVIDPFCGSGSTLIAAEITGLSGRGIELEPHYCDVIVQRWVDFTGQEAYRVNADGKKAWTEMVSESSILD